MWKTFKLVYRKFIQDNVYHFFQNRVGFVEDMTKTFWYFSVHSVDNAGFTMYKLGKGDAFWPTLPIDFQVNLS